VKPEQIAMATRYRRPAGDSPVKHVLCTCLRKSLPYLAPRHLLFLKDSSIHTVYPIVLSVGLSIHIPTSQLQYFDFGVHKVGPCTMWPERISHTFLVIARTFVRNLYLRRLYSLFMRTQADITISCICLQLDAEALYHH
jgi:hypothetical protein